MPSGQADIDFRHAEGGILRSIIDVACRHQTKAGTQCSTVDCCDDRLGTFPDGVAGLAGDPIMVEEVARPVRIGPVLQVSASAKHLAGAGQDGHPNVISCGNFIEYPDQVAPRLPVESVYRRAINGNSRHISMQLQANGLGRHVFSSHTLTDRSVSNLDYHLDRTGGKRKMQGFRID